jgi:hypothetical protein
VQLDRARDQIERGAGVAAGGAAVIAEVPDVRGGVLVGRPAAQTPLRIGRMLEARHGMATILEAEDDAASPAAAEVADLRIVAVHDQHRLVAELVDRAPPALGDELELAVPVELVAEEVAEAHGPRADLPRDLG